jgi:hypothetical protein
MARYDQANYDSGVRYDEEENPVPATSMRNLAYYMENPFDDDGISLDELVGFSTDHLQRFISNNPGALWNVRITATQTALVVVENCTTDDQVKLGLRKGKKLNKAAYRKALPANIARIHGSVVGKYGPDSAEVLECFPQGRSIFGSCTDDHLENHLQTLVTGVTAHQADLGAQVVSDAGGLLSTWLVIWGASESSTGAKTTSQEEKKNARLNLQLELFKNLLTIALNFPRQPEKLPLYMQQSLLEDHPAAPPEPPPGP